MARVRHWRPMMGAMATGAAVAFAAGSLLIHGGAPAASAVQRRPARPAFADLSAPVSLAGGECSFGPRLDGALRNMILFEGDPPVGRAGSVELGGRRLSPVLAPTKGEEAAHPGFHGYDASLSLSPAARWNGLRLTRLRLRTGWEWSIRSLEFAEPPARVQAALRAMHIAIPLPPGRRAIPTDACAQSIAIEPLPRGSALVCEGGC